MITDMDSLKKRLMCWMFEEGTTVVKEEEE